MNTCFKNLLLAGAGISTVFFGAVTPAMAVTATVTAVATTTLDVTKIVAGQNGFTGGVQNAPPFSPFEVQLAVGDTFDFTINFLSGQQLTVNNLSFIWAYSYADIATKVTGTGSLSLLGANGDALFTSVSKTTTEGDVHFGQQFNGSDFTSLPNSVTFSGLHYVGMVDSYEDSGVTTRTYADPGFFFTADSFTTTTPVPEPEAYAMLMAGLGLLGVVVRRRRQKST